MTETEKTDANLGSRVKKTEIYSEIRATHVRNPNRPKQPIYVLVLATQPPDLVLIFPKQPKRQK